MAQTQQRINHLLSMDYETFINSAFIVQGRADEFTQKGARQRKEVLAEILGLSRYDRLQERARLHFQKESQACEEFKRRLRELDADLVHQDKIQNHSNSLIMSCCEESMKCCQISQLRMNTFEISNVISTVLQWRWIYRRQPNRFNSQPSQIT